MLLCILLGFAATVHCDELAPDAHIWAQRIRSHFRHFPTAEFASNPFYGGMFEPSCRQLQGTLRFEPWILGAHLQQPDENLFYRNLYLSVRKLATPADAIALWRRAAELNVGASSLPPCSAAYHNEVLIQAGLWLFRLDGTCNQMKSLLVYEVADLVEIIRVAGLEPSPAIVLDRCGNVDVTIVPLAGVLADAQKTVKIYDHVLPRDRERAKHR
jgi:hypothetical protein